MPSPDPALPPSRLITPLASSHTPVHSVYRVPLGECWPRGGQGSLGFPDISQVPGSMWGWSCCSADICAACRQGCREKREAVGEIAASPAPPGRGLWSEGWTLCPPGCRGRSGTLTPPAFLGGHWAREPPWGPPHMHAGVHLRTRPLQPQHPPPADVAAVSRPQRCRLETECPVFCGFLDRWGWGTGSPGNWHPQRPPLPAF